MLKTLSKIIKLMIFFLEGILQLEGNLQLVSHQVFPINEDMVRYVVQKQNNQTLKNFWLFLLQLKKYLFTQRTCSFFFKNFTYFHFTVIFKISQKQEFNYLQFICQLQFYFLEISMNVCMVSQSRFIPLLYPQLKFHIPL